MALVAHFLPRHSTQVDHVAKEGARIMLHVTEDGILIDVSAFMLYVYAHTA